MLMFLLTGLDVAVYVWICVWFLAMYTTQEDQLCCLLSSPRHPDTKDSIFPTLIAADRSHPALFDSQPGHQPSKHHRELQVWQ